MGGEQGGGLMTGALPTGTPVETDKDFGAEDDPRSFVRKWTTELNYAGRVFQRFEDRSKKIDRRYRDDRESQAIPSPKKFNVLWANMQVSLPAHYSRKPEAIVEREHGDGDPVGRVASMILERSLKAVIEADPFNQVMEGAVQDRLLFSRGTAWVRYVPSFRQVTPPPIPVTPLGPNMQPLPPPMGHNGGPPLPPLAPSQIPIAAEQVPPAMTGGEDAPTDKPGQFRLPDGTIVGSDSVQVSDSSEYLYAPPPYEEVSYDEVVNDYIHWSDFRHTPGRRWSEVWWVGRRVHWTKDEVAARFDKPDVMARMGRTEPIASKISYNYDAAKDNSRTDAGTQTDPYKKAEIWEIWDQRKREALWIAKDYGECALDRLPDPLRLSGFFPCPRPMFGTMSTDSLEPIPDYYEYQDQAAMLDELTDRISLLTDALAVRGVYDKANTKIDQLLTTTAENGLIAVDNWAMFAEKGGLKGAVDWMPIDMVASTLTALVAQREVIKRDLYEISGMSDIIRGEGRAEETATAQALKGKFATLRLSRSQADVQRFARDLIRLDAEIMAEHIQPNTLMLMSSFDLMSANDPQEAALFNPAVQLLRDNKLRAWRIDIETDSTIALDEETERKGITEYLTALSQIMPQMIQLVQQAPQMMEWAIETLKMTARKFRAGRSVEAALDRALDQLKQAATQPKPPDPKMIEAQSKAEKNKADIANIGSQIQDRKQRIQLDTVDVLGTQGLDKSKEARNDAVATHDMALATVDALVKPVVGVPGGMRVQ